jgi:hypothetical protein
MTPQIFFPWLFAILLAMVTAGLALNKLLFKRLERSHPQKYEAMGRPSLFLRNNVATGLATLKFVFAREHRALGDSYLSRLSDVILVYSIIYLLFFLSFAFLVVGQSIAAA